METIGTIIFVLFILLMWGWPAILGLLIAYGMTMEKRR